MAKLGFKGGFYFNGATYDAPSWGEVTLLSDAALEAQYDEAPADVRGNNGVKASEVALLALGFSGKIQVNPDDAVFLAMDAAFVARAEIDVLVLDGKRTVDGSRGWRFSAKVHQWGEDQALGNVIYKDFLVKPCPSARAPKRAVVASSNPVFTDPG